MEVDYSNATVINEGDWIYVHGYYEDGTPKFSEQYLNKNFHGEQKYFKEDGSLFCRRIFEQNTIRREEQFEKGEMVRWKNWDERGKQIERVGFDDFDFCTS